MANAASELAKLKRRKSFGAPASLDDAAHSLSSPEVAPGALVDASASVSVEQSSADPAMAVPGNPVKRKTAKQPTTSRPHQSAPMVIETSPISVRLRRSRRIIPLSTRVTPEFDQLLRETAAREGVQFIDVLERALTAYVNGDES